MITVKIKNIEIGKGIPKICVPLTGKDENELSDEITGLEGVAFDIVEWRADYYEFNIGNILRQMEQIRSGFKKKCLLFTFRTAEEGGHGSISGDEYFSLYKIIIESRFADIVDIQLSAGESAVKQLVNIANKHGVYVLMSRHDFEKTPSKEALIKTMCRMQDLGADITKVAVMPKSVRDVSAVLDAMVEMEECYADKPFVAISMSQLGLISRIAGETFGSAITYGAVNNSSAPGQMDARELGYILNLIHKNMSGENR